MKQVRLKRRVRRNCKTAKELRSVLFLQFVSNVYKHTRFCFERTKGRVNLIPRDFSLVAREKALGTRLGASVSKIILPDCLAASVTTRGAIAAIFVGTS